MRQHRRLCSRLAMLWAGWLVLAPAARAQTRWIVAPRLSLAWWQIDPHMGHLWATTCPGELTWQPGSRSGGWEGGGVLPSLRMANASDTIHVPLYPRPAAKPVCVDAVSGEVTAEARRWDGVRGQVTVRAAALRTGYRPRDEYARKEVLQINRYPDIRFTIDSVVITARTADTLRGQALGTFMLRGVSRPVTAGLQSWPEAGGQRVLAKFKIPAHELIPVYGFSRLALGLGVGARVWQYVFAGVDLVLAPAGSQPAQ